MSFLNDAYRTLRNRDELRDYVLEQAGFKSSGASAKGGSIPLELAEGWFELQDSLMEDPENATPRLEAFVLEVAAYREKALKEISDLETSIDLSAPDAVERLRELHEKAQALGYVRSLERDLRNRRKAS